MTTLDRRTLLGSLAVISAVPALAQQGSEDTDQAFAQIRASLGRGGRLGVVAIDTGTGRRSGFDPHGRYAMCSVFKLPLAAFVLRLCDQRALDPGEMLKFAPGDPLDNSPVVQANLRRGRLSV